MNVVMRGPVDTVFQIAAQGFKHGTTLGAFGHHSILFGRKYLQTSVVSVDGVIDWFDAS